MVADLKALRQKDADYQKLLEQIVRQNEEMRQKVLEINRLNQLVVKDFEQLALQQKHRFTGRYESNELLAWYPIIDTLILPSYSEPFGAVTGEALLAGCRGIISKYCGSACLINEKNGIVFDSLDDANFQKALEYIIDSAKPTTKASERPNNMPINYNNKIKALTTFLND